MYSKKKEQTNKKNMYSKVLWGYKIRDVLCHCWSRESSWSLACVAVLIFQNHIWLIVAEILKWTRWQKKEHKHCFSSVLSLSRLWLFATPWTVARQASRSITNSRSSLKLMSIKWVMLAKTVRQCLTLCVPIDGRPSGSPVPGILQARTPEWVAVSFSSAWKWKVKVKSLGCVRLLATPWTAAYQVPPSMGFSRQECWSGVPLPSPWWCLDSYKFCHHHNFK